jgi:hypothetical protein
MLKMSLLNPPSYSLIYGLAAIAKSSLQYFEQKYLTGSKRKKRKNKRLCTGPKKWT